MFARLAKEHAFTTKTLLVILGILVLGLLPFWHSAGEEPLSVEEVRQRVEQFSPPTTVLSQDGVASSAQPQAAQLH